LQRKFGLIIGVLIIVVIALGVVVASGVLTSSLTKVNVVNNNYSGEGVSFNIPPNWQIYKIEVGSNTNFDIAKDNSNDTKITIAISPTPKGMSNQDLINSIQNPSNPSSYQKISNSTIIVDGNTAYENTYIFNDPSKFKLPMEEQQINFFRNGTAYGLLFDAPENTFDTEKSNFNITLNSLKIL
jgi:hypothetical protein